MNVYFFNWSTSYEQTMVRYLVKNYGVKNVFTPRKIHRLHQKFKFLGLTSSRIAKSHIAKKLNDIKSDDLLITHDSNIFFGVNKDVIKHLDCKKILLLRNPVSREFVDSAASLFDKIYTFEEGRSQELGVDYLPQFLPVGYKEAKTYDAFKLEARQPRCFFLGRDKGRIAYLTQLAERLEKAGCEIDFSIVKDKTSQGESPYYVDQEFEYSYSFLKTVMSDVVVDIVQQGQTGFTLRILEAIFLNKKVITNNAELAHSEFYSPERVFILGSREWQEISAFLAGNPVPLDPDLLYKYSPDNMLNTITESLGDAALAH